MRILHITNDYSGSTVYKNLISNIDSLGINQTVYNPIRDVNRIGINEIRFDEDSEIIYDHILNYTLDRIFFKSKIKKIYNNILSKVDIRKIDVIHAHTWFSDGAVAYEIFKKTNKPYIITIRNTDLNVFYKYFIHLKGYSEEILFNAKKIVFISEIYKRRFKQTKFYLNNNKILCSKFICLPNGVDSFWIDNCISKRNRLVDDKFRVLFIGKFEKGKNLLRLIEAVKLVNQSFVCELSIIGGGGNQEHEVLKAIDNKSFVKYYGFIFDKNELLRIFRFNDLFAMPSKAETFGLVYIEAISQGLPIINTINEGIYGMYDDIGESVDYRSIDEIAFAIKRVKENYERYNFDSEKILLNHDWRLLSKKYFDIYNYCL